MEWKAKETRGCVFQLKKKFQMAVYLIKAFLMRIFNKLSLDSVP